MKSLMLPVLLSLIVYACGQPERGVNQQTVQEGLEEQEIKRVLPGDIVEAAYEQGSTLAATLQQHLPPLADTVAAEQFSVWVKQHTNTVADSLRQAYQARIQWFAPQDTLTEQMSRLEQQLMRAYLYNVNHHMAIYENVQRIDSESYLYTKPLFYSIPEHTVISQQTAPSDSAIFMGMWSMQLSKKRIVQDI